MARDRKVDIIVGAQDKASKIFKQVGASIVVMNQGIELATKLARVMAEAYDFAKMGAEVEKTKFAFNRMTAAVGADADTLLAKMRDLTGGTISDFELMQKAAKATTLGVPIDKVGEFAEIARAAAAAMGESTAFMFDSIVTGTARQSKLILDNLGIIINMEQVYRDETARLGHELSETEKKQAFMNAVIIQGQDIIKNIGDTSELASEQFAKFEAILTNAKNRVAEIVGQNFGDVLANWGDEISDFVESAEFEEILANLATVLQLSAQAATVVPGVLLGMKDFFVEMVSSGNLFAANMAVVEGTINRMAENARRAAEATAGFIGPTLEMITVIEELIAVQDENIGKTDEQIEGLGKWELAGNKATTTLVVANKKAAKVSYDAWNSMTRDSQIAITAFSGAADMAIGKLSNNIVDAMSGGQLRLKEIFKDMAKDFLRLFIEQILRDVKLALVAKLISLLKLFDVRANDMMAIQMGRDYAKFFQQGVSEGMDFGGLAGSMARGVMPQIGGSAIQIGAAVPASSITVVIQGNLIGEDESIDNLILAIEDKIANKETATLGTEGADEWLT